MKATLKNDNFPRSTIGIHIGGSKSESNRMLILQAQFPNILIKNLSESDDTVALQKGLKSINGTVDIHHAGTAMRFLTAYFAVKDGVDVILTGSQRMQERPIAILVDALRSLGADIEYLNKNGFPPLKIRGKNLRSNEVTLKANVSSQYISALMLVAPMFPKGLQISLEGKVTSIPYIKMTLSLLNTLKIMGDFNDNKINISSAEKIDSKTFFVESDWSSASYFYSLVALSNEVQNYEITLRSFSEESLQGDSALVEIYNKLGVHTIFKAADNTITLSRRATKLPEFLLLDLANTPDLAQTIAVTCFGLGVFCKLTGLHTLKIKETDRLLALKNELEKLGAKIEVTSNSLTLEKSGQIKSGILIETYQDHRMAMAFAPLAIKAKLTINNCEVVSKSYPNFWKDLQKTGIGLKFVN